MTFPEQSTSSITSCDDRKSRLSSTAAVASHSASLHGLQFLLELLDSGMSRFKILVESVSLSNQLLLPLSESLLFDLDLLGESLSQLFFFLLEFRVVQLPWSGFAKL